MPTISNLPLLTQATGTIAFPVVDYGTDPDTTRQATFEQFRGYLETTVAVKSVAGRQGDVTLNYTDVSGLNSISHTGILTATTTVLGGLKLDGLSLRATSSGTISVQAFSNNGYQATFDSLGNLNIPNYSRIQSKNGGPIISGYGTTGTTELSWAGTDTINDGFYISETIRNAVLVSNEGITVKIDANNSLGPAWVFDQEGVLNLPDYIGDIKRDGQSVLTSNTATTNSLGLVKIGTGISVTSDGSISTVPLTTATTSTLGGIIVGAGLSISQGVLSTDATGNGGLVPSRFLILNSNETGEGIGENPTAPFPYYKGKAGLIISRGHNIDPGFSANLFFDDEYSIGTEENPDTGLGAFALLVGKTTSSGLIVNYIRPLPGDDLNFLGTNNPSAVLNVSGTTNYEQQVIAYGNDAIPNRKYVDIAQTNDSDNNFKVEWTHWAATSSTTIGYTGTYGGGIFIGDIGSAKDTNILIGSESGQNIVVDAQPNGIGGWNQYGVYNVAIGQQAGSSLTTGSNNVYIGNAAGVWQTYGDDNIAIGAGAGANTAYYGEGSYIQRSIAIGQSALGNSYGDDNIGIGFFAGNSLGGGGGNVIIGYDSGLDLTNISGNVAISDNRFPNANRKVLWDRYGKMTHPGIIEITTSSGIALDVTGGARIQGNLKVNQTFTATTVDVTGSLYLNGYALSTSTNGGGGGASITIKDEGTTKTTGVTSINFTGAGVIATNVGNDVTVTISGGGGGGGLPVRTLPSVTSASLAAGASGNYTITGNKSYVLLSIETSAAAWVTVYNSTSARTSDAGRTILNDPSPGSGVIAEVISTGASTQYFSPATIGYTVDSSTSIPVKIYNNGATSAAITVTLTMIQLEG